MPPKKDDRPASAKSGEPAEEDLKDEEEVELDEVEEDAKLPAELGSLMEEYEGFYANLRGEQRARRVLDLERVEDVTAYLVELQKNLETEGQERRLADACLDKLSQTRLDIVQQSLVFRFQTGLAKLHQELQEAKNRLGAAEEQLVAAREKSSREIKAVRMELNHELDLVQKAVRQETRERHAEDEITHKAIIKEIKDIQAVAKGMSRCREDVMELNARRIDLLERDGEAKAGQQAIDALFERLAELREALEIETEERHEEEDKTAETLQIFAEKLEIGLRIVNKSEYQ